MILDPILEQVQIRLAEARHRVPEKTLVTRISGNPPALHDFPEAIDGKQLAIIAEVKRASPSAGRIVSGIDPRQVAKNYEKAGAAAISVLTEQDHFQGSLGDLAGITGEINLPVLRKDFILDPYQILEARLAGASAFLLIVRILEPDQLKDLLDLGRSLGMAALVEVHDPDELDTALDCGAGIIGVNNRDLDSFAVDLETCLRVFPSIPPDIRSVAESGIRSREDLERVADAGYDAALIGEALMRNPALLAEWTREQ